VAARLSKSDNPAAKGFVASGTQGGSKILASLCFSYHVAMTPTSDIITKKPLKDY
jgi:hypothetical protein